jgi:redox-sensitive bicupin YhaK (pirin superfamily)
MDAITKSREVERVVAGVATSDGAGVRLTRVLTQDLQRRLDPFLMLDAFRSDDPRDYIAGFPEHPHRGFETVTYMLAGRMRHRDSAGNEGLLTAGAVQWMTAGRGIVHSEMPEQEDGLMEGFQLWLNLPARTKMTVPGYRDIPAQEIPEFDAADGVRVRAIAGGTSGRPAAVTRPDTEPVFLDLHLPAGARVDVPLPAGHNAFVYVYRGTLRVGATPGRGVASAQMAILETRPDADGVALACDAAARAILVAGRPLNEPIAQHGPFVMNTRDELVQAVHDFQTGRFV